MVKVKLHKASHPQTSQRPLVHPETNETYIKPLGKEIIHLWTHAEQYTRNLVLKNLAGYVDMCLIIRSHPGLAFLIPRKN
ncbi:hypothetical protein FKM82_029001 [Ascaphus truei]